MEGLPLMLPPGPHKRRGFALRPGSRPVNGRESVGDIVADRLVFQRFSGVSMRGRPKMNSWSAKVWQSRGHFGHGGLTYGR